MYEEEAGGDGNTTCDDEDGQDGRLSKLYGRMFPKFDKVTEGDRTDEEDTSYQRREEDLEYFRIVVADAMNMLVVTSASAASTMIVMIMVGISFL